MKLIVTESYEESSRVAADLYKNVIEHKLHRHISG